MDRHPDGRVGRGHHTIGEAVRLAAEQPHRRLTQLIAVHKMVQIPRTRRRGGQHPQPRSTRGGNEGRRLHIDDHVEVKHAAGARPHHLAVVDVHSAGEHHCLRARRIGGAHDCSGVAGVGRLDQAYDETRIAPQRGCQCDVRATAYRDDALRSPTTPRRPSPRSRRHSGSEPGAVVSLAPSRTVRRPRRQRGPHERPARPRRGNARLRAAQVAW